MKGALLDYFDRSIGCEGNTTVPRNEIKVSMGEKFFLGKFLHWAGSGHVDYLT